MSEKLKSAVPLGDRTTIRIGGPARYFCEAESVDALVDALHNAQSEGLPFVILGGGSNIIFEDSGFDGLVLAIANRGISILEESPGQILVEVQAGEEWDRFVKYAVDRGWSGIECLSGIPGRVGATPIQNVGAYGQEVSETIDSVLVYDLEEERLRELKNQQCEFAYRTSLFKKQATGRFIVTAVRFRLAPGGRCNLRYGELSRELGADSTDDLARVRATVLKTRRSKGMVIDPDDPMSVSCGSFFLNSVVSKQEWVALLERAGLAADAVPHFDTADGIKIPAAWLIEKAGFKRGQRSGAVGLSEKHALAIVNYDRASSHELREFARTIIERVQGRFGITLAPEPVFVGPAP